MLKYLIIIILLAYPAITNADAPTVDLSVKTGGVDMDIVLTLNKPIEYDFFTLSDPYRLIIDLKSPGIKFTAKGLKVTESVIRDVSEVKLNEHHRITVEFMLPMQLIEVNMEKHSDDNYHLTFVINSSKEALSKNNARDMNEFLDIILSQDHFLDIAKNSFEEAQTILTNQIVDKPDRKPVIVIDAGHGGKDPGAVNKGGDREKSITLQYALDLAKRLRKSNHYEVYLTRDKDKFISLGGRQYYARRKNADLFISLHADSAPSSKATGLSIYTLSNKSSDSVAAMLARKANKSDVIAGIDLTGENKDVANFMIDLSQRKGMQKSKNFSDILHKNIKNKINTVSKEQRYAGFAVLKNSNMASILIELGFVSNKSDVKKLKSSSYRKTLTKAIKDSIDDYFGY